MYNFQGKEISIKGKQEHPTQADCPLAGGKCLLTYEKIVLTKSTHTYVKHIVLLLYIFARCTEISQETAVNPVDIVSTLQSLQMLKYWKGKHLVLKRQVRLFFTVVYHFSKNYCHNIFTLKDHMSEPIWVNKKVHI